MGYFQTKSDLEFMSQFRDDVVRLWNVETAFAANTQIGDQPMVSEKKRAIRVAANRSQENYQQMRAPVSSGVLRASRLARRFGVPTNYREIPPPLLGGPIIEAHLFHSVLADPSRGGIDNQMVYDALNQTISELEVQFEKDRRRLVNPLYWAIELLTLIVRFPFLLIEASGFDVHKVEDHIFGRLFKLLEIAILLYLLIRVGFTPEQLREAILKLIP